MCLIAGNGRHAAQPALYYCVDAWVRLMYNIPEVRAHLRGWRKQAVHTNGRIDSWFDGEIFSGSATGRDLFVGANADDDVIPFAFCADSTVLKTFGETSFTPCVCDVLALPYWLRKTFESKFLWAVLPEGAKPNELFTRPFLEHGAQRRNRHR